MAKQTIVTIDAVAANSGSGTPLANAFKMVNENFTEVYAKPDLTLSTNTLTLTKPDGSTDTVDLAPYLDGDITSIIAGNGLTGSSLDTGDATLNVVGGDGITVAADEVEATVDDSTIELSATNGSGALRVKDLGVTTAKLANDSVTHDKMGVRFTEDVIKADTAGTGGSAITLDWSAGSIFKFSNSLTGAIELKFDSYKQNQVIDIYGLTGSQTVTLNSTASGTEVFKRIGSQEYDGTADNHIQVICLEDSASTPVFHFAIGTTTADDTP